MTIDEAIKHCEEVAEENDKHDGEHYGEVFYCKEWADERRQLADWLKELKAYRKAEKEIEQELVN